MPLVRAEFERKHHHFLNVLNHDISQVLYLPFDYDDGNYARDRSGYNNHGTIYGATKVTGKIGDARSFDGVNDYVKVGHSDSVNQAQDITIALWVKGYKDGVYQAIGKNSAWFATGAKGWHISASASPADLLFEVQNGTTRYNIRFYTGRTFDWTFITAVRRGNTIYAYTNCVLKDSRTVSGTMENLYDIIIGSFLGTSYFFKGLIDEVRIYNRALSQAEIQRIMNMRGL